MCQICEEKPVYEFTNQRKLCKRCFINYFHKKLLYTIRKFNMVKQGETIAYKNANDVNSIVLKKMLELLASKSRIKLVKLPHGKENKIALNSSLDLESEKVILNLIDGNAVGLNNYLPIERKFIKPLYLFLDEEIILYAKLNNLKFKELSKKKNKTREFIDSFEKNHPEAKRAIINSLLKIYS